MVSPTAQLDLAASALANALIMLSIFWLVLPSVANTAAAFARAGADVSRNSVRIVTTRKNHGADSHLKTAMTPVISAVEPPVPVTLMILVPVKSKPVRFVVRNGGHVGLLEELTATKAVAVVEPVIIT